MLGRHGAGRLPGRMSVEAFRELSVQVAADPFLAEIVERRRPIAVLDTGHDARCDPKQPTVAGAKSVLGLPLSLPTTTGAPHPVCGGRLFRPR